MPVKSLSACLRFLLYIYGIPMADNALFPLLSENQNALLPGPGCACCSLFVGMGIKTFDTLARGSNPSLSQFSSFLSMSVYGRPNIVYQKGGWVLTAGYYSLFPHNLIRSHNKNDPWGCFHTHARTPRAFHQIIIRARARHRINIIQHPLIYIYKWATIGSRARWEIGGIQSAVKIADAVQRPLLNA